MAEHVQRRRHVGGMGVFCGGIFLLRDPMLHVLDDGSASSLRHFGGGRLHQFEFGIEGFGFTATFGRDAVFAGEQIASAVIEAVPIGGSESLAERLCTQTGFVDGRRFRGDFFVRSFFRRDPLTLLTGESSSCG